MFKEIDPETWKRNDTFEFFRDYEDPFFNMTANVDVSRLYDHCKNKGLAFSLAGLYFSQQAVNTIRELRLRMHGETVVEYDTIHATQTILNDDETFSFCFFEMKQSLEEFERDGRKAREYYGKLRSYDVETDRLDVIYYSVIPWVSFTSFKHASRFNNRQTVPRIVFGKIFQDGNKRKIPVSVEVHHALADGIHVGKYYNCLQELVDAV
jgi:chloramphenicol O-acetyltransferase type A